MPGAPPPPQREEAERVLNVRIVEAKDVIADDDSANLFCRIMLTNPRDKKFLPKTTGILKRTNRPVWNQDFSFLFRGVSSLVVGVYGYHRLSKAVLLGRCAVEVQSIISKHAGEVNGTWFELYDRAFEKKTGSTIFLRHHVQELPENTGALALGGFENEAFVSSRTRLLNYRPSEQEAPESLSIYCATFNLGSEPLPVDLKPWIPEDDFDVFAIGGQEAVFAVGKDMMGKPKFNTCGAEWRSRLTQHFGNRYSMITATSTRGGIRLAVFVRTKYCHLISLVDSASVITTFNKGGAAISFFYKHTSFAFVNCHLSAHQNKTIARNAEVRHIMRSLKLKTTAPPQLDTLRQFHHVFWMGDLNYRLNFGDQGDALTPSETQFTNMVQKIQGGILAAMNFDELFVCDQLQTEMKEGRVFAEFQETPPTFPPTFKVERCFPVVYTKQRSPAWCDRVLWWSAPTLQVSQLSYDSANKITTSDHKPVSSLFNAEVWSLPPSYDDDLGPCNMFVRSLECHDLRKEDGAEELEEPAYDTIEISLPSADDKGLTHHRRTSSDDIYRSTLAYPGYSQNPTELDVYEDETNSPSVRPYAMLSPSSPVHSASNSLPFSSHVLPPPSSSSSSSPSPASSASPAAPSLITPNNNVNTASNTTSATSSSSFPPVSSPFSSPSLLPSSGSFTGPVTSWRLSPAKDDIPLSKEKSKTLQKTPKKLFRMLRKDKNENERLFEKEKSPDLSVRDKNDKKNNTLELKANDASSPKPRIARGGSLRAMSQDLLNATVPLVTTGRNMRSGSTTSIITDTSKGTLNPYVKFRSHFLLKSFSTPLRKKTQGMLWDASDFVDPLPLTVNNPHRLLREYLSVKVCHNPGGTNKFKMKKKVPIGSALIHIPLTREFLQQQRAKASQEGINFCFPFDVNLVKSGIIKGRLAGVLELQWGPPGDRRQPGQATSKRPAPIGKEKKFITKPGLIVTQPGFSRPNSDIDDDDSSMPSDGVLEVVATVGNWQAVRDMHGKIYFSNSKTHVTTWEQPQEFSGVAFMEPEILTTINGWQVMRDKMSGRLYYSNALTSTWEMPSELQGVVELAGLLTDDKASRRQTSIDSLPRGVEPLPPPPPMRRCSFCHSEVKPSAQDCPSCGHLVEESLQITTETTSSGRQTLRASSLKLPFLASPTSSPPSGTVLQSPPTPLSTKPPFLASASEAPSHPATELELLQQRKLKVLADAYLQIQMPDVLSATDFDDEGLSDSD